MNTMVNLDVTRPPPSPVTDQGASRPQQPAPSADAAQRDGKVERPKVNLDKKDLQALTDEMNTTLTSVTSLRFSVDKDSKQVVVKVVDQNSNKVIRQIPSEDMVSLAKKMKDLQGMLVDAKA